MYREIKVGQREIHIQFVFVCLTFYGLPIGMDNLRVLRENQKGGGLMYRSLKCKLQLEVFNICYHGDVEKNRENCKKKYEHIKSFRKRNKVVGAQIYCHPGDAEGKKRKTK